MIRFMPAITPAHTGAPTRDARLRPAQTLLVGSLLFGLFFGAGNLIFPVEMGRAAGSHTAAATVGFLLTAVGLPLLGIVASALSGASSLLEMTSGVARWYALGFTCALYLTIGPAFAIPRTATVSYEVGLAPSLGDGRGPLLVFTLVFFALTGAAALRPGRLIDYVGRYLTPVFLVLLAAVVVASFVAPMTNAPLHAPQAAYATSPLTQGLLDGYNTMDALASLAFAIVVIEAVGRLGVTSPAGIARETAKGGIVSVLAMAAIYASLAYVGATSLGVSPDARNGGQVLAGVSRHYYGTAGQWLIGAIVLVACLKTAIGLVTACAEMFAQMLPRVGYHAWALTFTLVSCAIANVGLAAIVEWSIPVLVFLYPLAITAIVLGLLSPWLRHRRNAHRVMTAAVALAAVCDLVKALPVSVPGGSGLVELAGRVLPGYGQGFGWVVPGVLGLLVGLALDAASSRGARAV